MLVLIHSLSGESSNLYLKFNLNTEGNIPTWYSTILLFSVSAVSFFIYQITNLKPGSNKINYGFWLTVSFTFLFLSLDEASQIHELIDQHTSIKWVYVYAPFGALFFSYCGMHFYRTWKENKRIGTWILGGLIVYACGGLLCEWVSHHFQPLPPFIQKVEFIMEEGLEMFGVILILTGCLNKLDFCLREVIMDRN